MARITADAASAEGIAAGLELAGDEGVVSWQDADTGAVQFDCFHTVQAEAEQHVEILRTRLGQWAPQGGWALRVEALPDADWQEAWKHFFPAERVSPNVMVRPPWEPGDAQIRCVVEINPGLSFGTGRHFTTRTCLQALDHVSGEQPGVSLVDAGCGSGILAIAAVKLGFTRVTAFDNDPQAILSARENVVSNGVLAQMTLLVSDVDAFQPEAPFTVVVANLYDALLHRFAPAFIRLLTPGPDAHLVLSGMLVAQVPAVRDAYAALGFDVVRTWADVEWTTLLLARRGAMLRCR
ncbi:MAG: 50S ribosomal protein L11 methyltransferase [Verrucomicrobia bacterium]|nr:50S ribosomal protein L11 methyltransferase [Verrucomicrobiota bacterium]